MDDPKMTAKRNNVYTSSICSIPSETGGEFYLIPIKFLFIEQMNEDFIS
jgi:hypothetical protein